MQRRHKHLFIWSSAILIGVAALSYGGYRYYKLNETVKNKNLTIEQLRSSIAELSGNLSLTAYERDRLQGVLIETEQQASALKTQTQELAGTVDTLQKLTTLDPELLKKYSKVYFLNEHYVPTGLSDIDPAFVSGSGRTLQIHTQVQPFLDRMLLGAQDAGLGLKVSSAYRSFTTQSSLKAAYKVTYGTTAANKFSADQGYSEHQLGTTVDLTTAKTGTLTQSFDKSPEFIWLTEHAHEYGFVLSYPKNNKYYIYEPWHWRFVGVALATKLYEDKVYLYDFDQRKIDDYLISIFD